MAYRLGEGRVRNGVGRGERVGVGGYLIYNLARVSES